MATDPILKRHRAGLSCTRCHRRKKKCNRVLPCNNCSRQGVECIYSHFTENMLSEDDKYSSLPDPRQALLGGVALPQTTRSRLV
ncbi:hypothetical protein V2G26_007080 [Clonostachys chloroleuca]